MPRHPRRLDDAAIVARIDASAPPAREEDLARADEAALRPSIRLQRAARLMDCDVSTLYKALRDGRLEGHKLNRAHRVYLDSLRAWQQSGATSPAPPERDPRKRHEHAGYRDALAKLRARGVRI